MQIILLLAVITIIVIWISIKIWKKTKSVRYILGFFAIYYWTFCGAWVFVIDQMFGAKGEAIGIHYYGFFEKLFLVYPDGNYFLMVLYYGIFFIGIQLSVLLLLRFAKSNVKVAPEPVRISHPLIITGVFLAIISSYLAIHKNVMHSIDQNTSIYLALNALPNGYLSLHKIFNLLAAFTLFFGFVVFLSGRESVYFTSFSNRKYGLFYYLGIPLFFLYFIIIGNKHDLLFAELFAFLFYLKNSKKIVFSKLVIFVLICALPFGVIDLTRGTPLFTSKEQKLGEQRRQLSKIAEGHSVEKVSKKKKVLSLAFNNEMFYAHFSMYGALDKNIPITFGSSFKSLISSFIPRLIVKERPEDIYEYYTRKVNAKTGQGYTIHHATGWYLNFGIIGILLGALIWGCVWFFAEYYHAKYNIFKYNFVKIFFILAPFLFVAYVPTLLRCGLEAYKALLYEAFLLPILVVFLTSWLPTFLKRKQRTI